MNVLDEYQSVGNYLENHLKIIRELPRIHVVRETFHSCSNVTSLVSCDASFSSYYTSDPPSKKKKLQPIRIIIAPLILTGIVITVSILNQKNAINIYSAEVIYVWQISEFRVTLE